MAHAMVRERLQKGDVAVDATAGNGHDTEFLARAVGGNGRVYAFDVQQAAIEKTRRRLTGEGLDERVELFCADHSSMLSHLDAEDQGRIAAVMFNLGYLPGGDKEVITNPQTSVLAVDQAVSVLRPGGVVTVVAYVGHPGGQAEASAIEELIEKRLPPRAEAVKYHPMARSRAPYLMAIRLSEDL